ncbi:YcaO-like family protein [Oceanibacterium hippocampi]|uniref:YcaO-like family protein n=1 Tax=Oceanibacterium hippocampi TaxID=745714 RepID=A0A1Y5U197_9PROT|nr:YcaO-like family protein [Oceanibacterium hippocampi]SLN76087.1 YcaO-like family protein [Oceanibacterium hippocampi]
MPVLNIFHIARRVLALLQGRDGTVGTLARAIGIGPDLIAPACELLALFGYAEGDGAGRYRRSSALARPGSPETLLALAARMTRLFRLPSGDMPGGFFFGAELDPAAFRIGAAGDAAAGVGGKGDSLLAAFESCLGEAAEHVALHSPAPAAASTRPQPESVPPDGWTAANWRAAYRWMRDGLGADPTRIEAMPWLAAEGDDGRALPIPAPLILRQSAGDCQEADSSGLAAGPDVASARLQALLEAVERDAVMLWWHGGRPAPALVLDRDNAAALDTFATEARGTAIPARRHWFLDLTSDIAVPVVAALSAGADGGAVAYGFAADPDPAIAARRAFIEMGQFEIARTLAIMKRAQSGDAALGATDRAHIEGGERLSLEAFPRFAPSAPAKPVAARPDFDGDSDDDGAGRFAMVRDALAAAGYAAFFVDLTRPDIAVPVFRAIVPGLQSARVAWRSRRLARVRRETGPSTGNMPALFY